MGDGSAVHRSFLVVDDVPEIRWILEKGLTGEGVEVHSASDCQEALGLLENGFKPDLVILDLMLPNMSGQEFLLLLGRRYPTLKSIIISARGDVESIVQAMQNGALDYVHKPFTVEEIKLAIDKALSQKEMMEELNRLRVKEKFAEEHPLIYTSREMADVLEIVGQVAQTDVPLLITGESGTGKEVVAREVHLRSQRSAGPFVKVNCAAIPGSLLESELFGYEKGAFTGAFRAKASRFESARGGTLFLDEIGELDPPIQAKFLQVLQDGTFSPLGSNKLVRSDARVVVATNKRLEDEVRAGRFRSDLFYRLNVVQIPVPPLRERPLDIPILAKYFLDAFNKKYGKVLVLDGATMENLAAYSWPGNVRELQNVIRRFVVLGQMALLQWEGETVSQGNSGAAFPQGETFEAQPPAGSPGTPDALPVPPQGPEPSPPWQPLSLKDVARKASQEAERGAILDALQKTRWNKFQAAKLLMISYKALLYKIKELNIEKNV